MSRFSICCSATLSVVVMCAGPSHALAQQPAAPPANAQQQAPQQRVSPELWQLLDAWAKGSGGIVHLYGEHERHVYDGAFEIEKVSNGQFWYQAPDKGRIDVAPIKITAKMLAARKAPDARVELKQNGEPFELKSDDAERWLCDGKTVFDINDAQKSAKAVNLPPDLRGQNIMNSPLPFLFGLPPEKAVERFNMKLEKDYRPKYDVVLLSATPRWRQDADNWRSAQIYLDTKTFLPTAVKMVDPAGTKRTVYKFKDMKTDRRIIDLVKDPWNPRIDGYQVHVIQPGQGEKVPEKVAAKPPQNVIPNVVGQPHNAAEQMLVQAGVLKANISKRNAGPAPRANLTFLVRAQNPPANTPLNQNLKVVLMIFDRPAAENQRAGKVPGRQ